MTENFTLIDPGEGIHEAEILEIFVEEGDVVHDGDDLLTIETDKASMDIPAPFDGTIADLRVAVGDVVEVGSVLLTYSPAGAEGDAADESEEAPEQETRTAGAEPATTATTEATTDEGAEASGRKDEPASAPADRDERAPVRASPATRRLASQLGVDLREVEPGHPDGRVTASDVRAHAGDDTGRAPDGESTAQLRASVPGRDFERWGEIERVPLRSVRRTTARRMSTSWSEIPHVFHHDIADITDVERLRQEHAPSFEGDEGQLTLTAFVLKAAVAALRRYPRFNASLDDDAVVLKKYVHIGVAVDTEDGLLVPVVRDVDRKSLTDLAAELPALVQRARDRDLDPDEMRGASFTVTNPGPIGGALFVPLINPPQVAILGTARARLEMVVDGTLSQHRPRVALRLPLCLSFDHRVNDGADAARFLRFVVTSLEDTGQLLLRA